MSRITISLALVLILAAPAQAGTIELRKGATADSANFYVFTAAPGERNDIVVEEVPGGFRLRDAASPPAGCVRDGPDAVRCARATREISLTIDAGDGDDRVTADGSVGSILGGPGDDQLSLTGPDFASLAGGDGDDVLQGGPGDDTLDGGPGADSVSGGDGRDMLDAGRDGPVPGPDRLDGGAGRDTVSYLARTRPIRVDLQLPGEAGEPGERDVLSAIEIVVGGAGADDLRGDGGDNELRSGDGSRGDRLDGRGGDDLVFGDSGDDMLVGGPGDDSLGGESGRDRYAGGTGDDRIFVEFAREATVGCGSGTDRIFVGQRNGARLDADCERVQGVGPLIGVRRDAGGHLRGLDLRWNEREYRTPCRVRVTFSDGRRALGRVDLRAVSQRRTRIARLARHVPGGMVRVTLRASDRCAGRFGRGYTPTAFQVAS